MMSTLKGSASALFKALVVDSCHVRKVDNAKYQKLCSSNISCNCSSKMWAALQMRALVEMDNSGLIVLLEQDQYDDLARMYSLFKRVDDGLTMIRKIMGEHLKTAGSALVQDPESTKDPVDFVHRLLAMKDKYDR